MNNRCSSCNSIILLEKNGCCPYCGEIDPLGKTITLGTESVAEVI